MMTVRIRREARCDYEGATDWYRRKSRRSADRFDTAVKVKLDEIAQFPDRFPCSLDDVHVREAVVRGFPYSIFYQVMGSYVMVFAIYHHSRDPEGWKNRL